MPLFRRTPTEPLQPAGDDVLWGVPRREAASDSDDPLVHAGLTQHAFLLGNDERAICGFRPPVRAGFGGRARVPQLALPAPDNPKCSKCVRLLAAAAPTPAETADRAEEARSEAEFVETAEDEHPEPPMTTDAEPGPARDAASSDVAEAAEDQREPESARDEAKTPKRSSVRRAGRISVPQGRRLVVTHLPAKLLGATITAEVDGSVDDLRVLSVRVADDGTVRITLNQRTSAPVDLVLYVVSGPQRP